jgi:hypothetical protein
MAHTQQLLVETADENVAVREHVVQLLILHLLTKGHKHSAVGKLSLDWYLSAKPCSAFWMVACTPSKQRVNS